MYRRRISVNMSKHLAEMDTSNVLSNPEPAMHVTGLQTGQSTSCPRSMKDKGQLTGIRVDARARNEVFG